MGHFNGFVYSMFESLERGSYEILVDTGSGIVGCVILHFCFSLLGYDLLRGCYQLAYPVRCHCFQRIVVSSSLNKLLN